MEWKRLTKAEAKQLTGEWNSYSADDFLNLKSNFPSTIPGELNQDYKNLRTVLLNSFDEIVSEARKDPESKGRLGYCVDYQFGVRMYRILSEYGFSVRLAATDEIWFYLSLVVLPDLVMQRYNGKKTRLKDGTIHLENVNEDRFWKKSRRIYLKAIWWYVYLSLQEDKDENIMFEKTLAALKNNNTDTIVQLVERAGNAGYRVDLYREIIQYYYHFNSDDKVDILRKVMVLNTARTIGTEPSLHKGGTKGYVKELFDYFG